jgi:hypothetical protein
MQVDSEEAIQQTLSDHPVLSELRAGETLVAFIEQAQVAGTAEGDAPRLVVFATLLAGQYLLAHAEQIVPDEQKAFVALLAWLTAAADALGLADLAQELAIIATQA